MRTPEIVLGVYRVLGGFPLRSIREGRSASSGVVTHDRTWQLVAWSCCVHAAALLAPFFVFAVLWNVDGADRLVKGILDFE